MSFSKLQTFVGLAAGILSIAGALAAFFRPAPQKAELVAIVQDAKTGEMLMLGFLNETLPNEPHPRAAG